MLKPAIAFFTGLFSLATLFIGANGSSSSYTSYNWIVASTGYGDNKWTITVGLEHATKTCGLVATGSEPSMVIVPMSRKPQVLSTQRLVGKFNSNECYFEGVLDFQTFTDLEKEMNANSSLSLPEETFQKLEIYIDELYSPSYEVKVEKTRFTLPIPSIDDSDVLTEAESTALTFSTAGDVAFPLGGFQGYSTHFSSMLPFQYSDDTIYLTTPQVFTGDANTIISTIDMSTATALATIDCSSDSKGASFGYVQEIAGFLFQRQNDEFNVFAMPVDGGRNRTNTYGLSGSVIGSAMAGWTECPIDVAGSPNHFKRDYIAFSFPTEVKSWQIDFDSNSVSENPIGTFPGVLSVAFRGDKDNQIYVLSGAAGDDKKMRSCDLSAATDNDCMDSTPIYWISETGGDSVTLRISVAQKPLQTQFLYSNTAALNLMTLGGHQAEGSPAGVYDQIIASPYNNNDFFALDIANEKLYHLYGVFSASTGALTHFGTTELQDLSSETIIGTILGISLRSSNEPCVYYTDTSDTFSSTCYSLNSNYAKSSKVTYHTSISNNIFDFKLAESNNLASIQEPVNYDHMQSHIYLGRSANAPDTSVLFNIMNDAVVFSDSIQGTNSSDRFVLANNTEINGSLNSGVITENSFYTDSSDSIGNMGNFRPGSIDSISYVAFKYKDSNDNIMVESLPIQVGCAKNMELTFDYKSALAKSGEDRKLNFDISQKYILMEDEDFIEDKRLVLTAEEGATFDGSVSKGTQELQVYMYNFQDTLFPKFKVVNSVTGQEFPYSDQMQLTVVGSVNVHQLFVETDYDVLYDLAYPDANTHNSDHQFYKDHYIKQALGSMHYDDQGIFDAESFILHNGHNQYGDNATFPNVNAIPIMDRLTYFVAQKNLLKLSDSSREIGLSTCTYSTDPTDPGIGCNLLDDSQDRSVIAAVNFNCPFDSTCDIKTLPWRFRQHMGTFMLEFWNSLPLLMSPSYVLKIRAQTSDSENMCELDTYFYVHVEGVGVNVISSLIILSKWIIYALVATLVLYFLNVNDKFLYKNLMAFFKAAEIYIKHNMKASVKIIREGKDSLNKESQVHFDDETDGDNIVGGRTSITGAGTRKSVITNRQSLAIQRVSQNAGMSQGYQSFNDTFKQVHVARESVAFKNKVAQETLDNILKGAHLEKTDDEKKVDEMKNTRTSAIQAMGNRMSQGGRLSQAGAAANEVKRASMMGEMGRNRRMSVGMQQMMQNDDADE